MDPELLKIAATNLGMGGALALILFVIVKELMARDKALIERLVQVIELNSDAMSDIRVALEEIKGFMERLDARLGEVEKTVARIEGRLGSGGQDPPRTF